MRFIGEVYDLDYVDARGDWKNASIRRNSLENNEILMYPF
jgi:hypothetical protein